MTKTPEELAEEYAAMTTNNLFYREPLSNAFSAGYQAAAPQWISVKDRLPEEHKEILWCHAPTQKIAVGYLLRADIKPYFTHWMPLPKPPEG